MLLFTGNIPSLTERYTGEVFINYGLCRQYPDSDTDQAIDEKGYLSGSLRRDYLYVIILCTLTSFCKIKTCIPIDDATEINCLKYQFNTSYFLAKFISR